MTEKHLAQIAAQLPQGEVVDRMYQAFEGDIRVITRTAMGREVRHRVVLDDQGNAVLEKF